MATGREEPGLTQRQAAESAELLLELVHRARVHRVVPAVVRTWGHLVDEEPPAVGDEQLHAQHPDVLHPLGDRDRERTGLRGQARRHASRDHGGLQDAVPVAILPRRERGDSAVRPAGQHDRQLGLERQPLLQHAGHPAEPLERRHGPRRDSVTVAWPLPS